MKFLRKLLPRTGFAWFLLCAATATALWVTFWHVDQTLAYVLGTCAGWWVRSALVHEER